MNFNHNKFVCRRSIFLLVAAIIIFSNSCKAQKVQYFPEQKAQTMPAGTNDNRGGCQNHAEIIDPGQLPETKMSDLIRAVLQKNTMVVKKLLRRKVDLEERDKYRGTALLYAVTPSVPEVDLTPPGQTRRESPPQQRADALKQSREEQAQIEITGELLAHGANPNQKDIYGETPLNRAVGFGYKSAHSIKLSTLLLQHQADVNAQDGKGLTPLMEAVRRNAPEIVKFLLDHNADLDLVNCDGQTALSIAESKNFQNIVVLLKRK